ncbi:hypothetical protein [Rhodohalobacter sp. 8-1]|uniref:hypothetical protein n=1 Tax=Rhodohalobacter sp. 8-1 TaxID=3131972 RepID=UPI0030EB32CC
MISSKSISILIFSILSVVLFIAPESVAAQESETYRIETVDGNVFIGDLISETNEDVTILTDSAGDITISRENIKEMTLLDRDRMRDNQYWHENPQSTRYLFAPNALGIKKGQGYYQNTWILFNNVNYGITNNFSLGAGTVPLFLFGSPVTPFWIMPKLSIPLANDLVHLSAGALVGGVIGEDGGSGGLLYGTGTVGNADKNATIGLGYAYGEGEISSTPVVNISGMYRTGKSIFLISENYFVPNTGAGGMVSFGVRWAPENFAVDFALLRPLEDLGFFVGIPWLGITIPFGR